ncbi:MAG: (Fe-S)-binding protein [Desulfobacterales bacterium]|nr:(Fe-S)-binding protein [Desulfobacterales bacterium]
MNINYDLARYKYDMEKCVGCKGCVWVDHIYMPSVEFGIKCASNIYNPFDAYAYVGRSKIGLAVLAGRLDYSDKLLDVIYKCNLCGACDAGCKRNLDLELLSVLESLRAKCVADGKGPLPAHKAVADHIEASGNRFGAPRKNRLQWLSPAAVSQGADLIYFPGCAASYLDNSIARATVEILKRSGQAFATLADQDYCCARPLLDAGLIDAAKKVAESNIRAFAATGAKTILTSCAECYKTWKVDYPKLLSKSTQDMPYTAMHLSEFVDDQLEKGKLRFTRQVPLRATWHDPCNLGRLSEPWNHWEGNRGKFGLLDKPKEYRRGTHGVYKAPRNILSQIPGMELVEMPRIRENTLCCGAGGGVREAFRDYARKIGEKRMTEAGSIAVEAVVSGCPYCKENFNNVRSPSEKGIKVYDLSEIVLMSLAD